MSKWFKYFLSIIFCIFLFVPVNGQISDSFPSVNVEVEDTVYQTINSTDENYQFRERPAERKIGTRKVAGADLDKLKLDEDYWYINKVPPRARENSAPDNENGNNEKKKSRGLFNIPWLNVLFWVILIGGFVALLVWFLSTSDVRLFRKKTRPVDEEVQDEITDDIFEMNFEKEIQKATEARNYRLAVRHMYLRTLRDLANYNLINYTHEKTNSDYLLQMSATRYYKSFFQLTRNFDYTWYGKFELTQDSFAIIQHAFSAFKQQLS